VGSYARMIAPQLDAIHEDLDEDRMMGPAYGC